MNNFLSPEVGDIAGKDVQIFILEVTPAQVEAEVVSVDNFWTRGFKLGERLKLKPNDHGQWIIDEKIMNMPRNAQGLRIEHPWFILSVTEVAEERLVCFEHYR
jgi:hypothetical protein